MKPTIVICGYGSGISDAVARRFGREGFKVAIVARTASQAGPSICCAPIIRKRASLRSRMKTGVF